MSDDEYNVQEGVYNILNLLCEMAVNKAWGESEGLLKIPDHSFLCGCYTPSDERRIFRDAFDNFMFREKSHIIYEVFASALFDFSITQEEIIEYVNAEKSCGSIIREGFAEAMGAYVTSTELTHPCELPKDNPRIVDAIDVEEWCEYHWMDEYRRLRDLPRFDLPPLLDDDCR